MSDNEANRDDDGVAYGDDDNAHQACYLFKPFSSDDVNHEQPVKKRRKTKSSPEEQASTFPLLNHGAEAAELAQLRYDTFKQAWTRKKARIDALVETADKDVLAKIAEFIQRPKRVGRDEKLQTGLIVSGPDVTAQTRLLEQWRSSQVEKASEIIIQLNASHCFNLQTTLKNIIRHTITNHVGQAEYQAFLNKHKRLIPMNFDLELLQIFVEEKNIQNIIISILDVETFDMGVLSELLSSLKNCSATIPITLLLGVATTVQLFESRLSRSAIDLLDATKFTLQSSGEVLQHILDDIQVDTDQLVEFGTATISAFEDLMQSQSVTIESFTSAIKYAFMSHFFANSLSVLLSGSISLESTGTLCDSIKNTTSFKQHCENLIQRGSKNKSVKTTASNTVSELLTDDAKLLQTARPATSTSASHFSLREAYHLNSRQILNPFTPQPRRALERSLTKPANYLACECCQSSASTSSSTAPPTSILYNLLQEAGTVINVRDLYDAFCARCFPVASDEDQNEYADKADRTQMSMFYACLAELKMLGLVKSSTSAIIKKKALAASGGGLDASVTTSMGRGRDRYGDVDFIAKTGWAGL